MNRFMGFAASATLLAATAIGVSAQDFPLYLNNSGVIRQVSTSGTVSNLATVSGGLGMATSDGGRGLYVATGSGISRVNLADGTVTSFATGLTGAKSVGVDALGNIYTTNFVAGTGTQVVKYTLAGVSSVVATVGVGAGNAATFGNDLALDAGRGLLYADGLSTNAGSTAVYRINLGTGASAKMGDYGTAITGLTVDSATNRLFAAEFVSSTVWRVNSAATSTSKGTNWLNNDDGSFNDQDAGFTGNPQPATAQKYYDVAFNGANGRTYLSVSGSSAGATDGLIASKLGAAGNPTPGATTDPAQLARVDFANIGDARYITFATVPAPSSVAVMAMGGLMPLVAFARRRRAAK